MRKSQAAWLGELLYPVIADIASVREDIMLLDSAIRGLQKGLFPFVERLHGSPKTSPAERILLGQMLLDIMHPNPAPPNTDFIADQERCARLLYECGDLGGAILCLHGEIMCSPSSVWAEERFRKCFKTLQSAVADFSRRMAEVLEKMDISLSREEKEALMDPVVVKLPYGLAADVRGPQFATDEFTRASFTWPWIRHTISKIEDSATATPRGVDLNWEQFFEFNDNGLQDIFGHSYLHVALLVGPDSQALTVARRVLSGVMDISTLLAASSFESDDLEGLTPLAYAAATGSKDTFDYLYSLSTVAVQMEMADPYYWPMVIAAEGGRLKMVQALLGADGDPEQKRKRLLIADEMARSRGHRSIAELISKSRD